jgi:hypothetical protein
LSLKRQDTRLEAEGAEFLVCAHLLIDGIPAYKTYTQMPGYDLVAVNPELGTSARIQVKSRWASDSDHGFPLKNLDADFVVFVLLNRGNRYRSKEIVKQAPEMFVFPMEVVASVRRDDGWHKVMTKRIVNRDDYRENWDLVRHFLERAKRVTE